jgi:hypothetical protein
VQKYTLFLYFFPRGVATRMTDPSLFFFQAAPPARLIVLFSRLEAYAGGAYRDTASLKYKSGCLISQPLLYLKDFHYFCAVSFNKA